MADDQATLSPDEISRRINAAVGMTHDLLGEVVSLLRLIAEGLEASDIGVSRLTGHSHFGLPRKKSDSRLYRYLTTDLGFIVEVGGAETEDIGDDVTDDDEDGDDDEGKANNKLTAITPDTQLLGIRAVLHDPHQTKKNGFEPVVTAVCLSSVMRLATPKAKKNQGKQDQTSFSVGRGAFQRLAKQCESTLQEGQQVVARIKGGRIAATVGGIVTQPLAAFNSEEAVNEFVEQVLQTYEGT